MKDIRYNITKDTISIQPMVHSSLAVNWQSVSEEIFIVHTVLDDLVGIFNNA
jgi:hypothetical protein